VQAVVYCPHSCRPWAGPPSSARPPSCCPPAALLPPSCRPPAGNPLLDAVRFKNPSKSTLAHDAVAAAVLHKHHPIIRVGAGLTRFVYGSRSHFANGGYPSQKCIFAIFARFFLSTTNSRHVHQRLTLSAQCLHAIPQSSQFVFCTSR